MPAVLIAGGAGIALLLVFLGLDRCMRDDDPVFEDRLRRYALRQGGASEPVETRGGASVTSMMSQQISGAIAGRTFAANLQADIARADLKLTPAEFLLPRGTPPVVLAPLGFALVSLLFGPTPLALPIFGLIGFMAPKVWISRRQAKRLKAFNDQLADTIVLMSNSLRSGMS